MRGHYPVRDGLSEFIQVCLGGIIALCTAFCRCSVCPSLAPAGHGKTISRARISGCSGDLHGPDPLHGCVRVYPVAETFGIQPLQHSHGHSSLLRLVVGPASTKYIAAGAEHVKKVHKALVTIGHLVAGT